MKTAIITIGDEILIGQIIDTNSSWIANKMTMAGFEIEKMASIADNAQQIKSTIDAIFQRVDVILMTGGIGPTKDDITKRTLCEYFNTRLVFDESVLNNIKELFPTATTINPLTRDQAYVPENATIIQNKVGTAPITWFERDGKVLVSMPGVPYEMQYAVEHEIIPRLQKQFETESYIRSIFIVGGYSESALATHLTDFENSLPEGFGLAYLPALGQIRLRLYVKGESRRDELNRETLRLEKLLEGHLMAREDISIGEIVGKKLLEKGLTLSTAESCTGGNIAHLLTVVPGSSRYFKGTIVSYANEVKINMLGVSPQTLDEVGAVSEEVVIEMAKGALKQLHTDCTIAVSGIAGPDGGTEDKPVGTVWICTACKGVFQTRRYQFGQHRESNITRASNFALQQLLGMLM